MNEKRVKWTCPHCGYLHFWYWDEGDIFEGETNMNCDGCHKHSKQMMHVNPINGNAWCEAMNKTMTELEQLKEQAKKIQQQIEYLEEVERKKKENKSLHNVIAKWEFYYSERIEKMVHSRDTLTTTFRDIVSEEIDKLLNDIEEWIDNATDFPFMTYEPGYWVGWDECRKAIKSKLRGPYDFYEISKVNNHYE